LLKSIKERTAFLISFSILFLGLVGISYVIAIGSADWTLHGHDAGEVDVTVDLSNVCMSDGTNCPPDDEGVTSVSAGTGIALSANPITDTGSVTVDTGVMQRRVSGTCGGTQGIRSIDSNGNVVCENIPSNTPCTFKSLTFSTGFACCMGGLYYIRCQADGSWSQGVQASCTAYYDWCTNY